MTSAAAAWARLGDLLIQRRIEIAPRYRVRTLFASDAGLNWRLLYDIERHKRVSFTDETLAAIEVAYRWRRGSVASVLAGGDPVPSPGSPGAPRPAPDRSPALERIAGDPDLSPELKTAFLKLAGRMAENSGGEENGPEEAEG